MTSKAELKRLLIQNPIGMADRVYELERERDALRRVLRRIYEGHTAIKFEDKMVAGEMARVAAVALTSPPTRLILPEDARKLKQYDPFSPGLMSGKYDRDD